MFKGLLDRFKTEDPSYIDIDLQEAIHDGKISIQVENLADYSDSERIQNKLRDGYILLVKIRDLKKKNMSELKRAVSRIRKTAMALNGDIAGIGNNLMVIAPSSVKVERRKLRGKFA